MKPKTLVLAAYGINCDEETKFAFERAGAEAELVHVNDLIDGHKKLSDYQILAFPGGFSYGDDTGAGKALANRIENHLREGVRDFISKEGLVIGICNGFQVMTNLGLLPGIEGNYGERKVALIDNDSSRFDCRWVDLEFNPRSPWTQRLKRMSLPIAHGEGKFYTDSETLRKLHERKLVAATYVSGEICQSELLPANPNGSLDDIACLIDESGRILGLMPHPERAVDFTQLPNWTLLKEQYRRSGREIPNEGPGIKIFRNGVNYFS